MTKQITTVTFFKYQGIYNKVWAVSSMLFMHIRLRTVHGQSFYKLLGSGKSQFNPYPDWSVYALLQVWNSEHDANEYLAKSKSFTSFKKHTSYQYTVFLKNIKSKGTWAAKTPFTTSNSIDTDVEKIAVITRATIKINKLILFWKTVPSSQQGLVRNDALLFSKGIGEAPIFQMATFSIWENEKSLNEFAYKSSGHVNAIKKTKRIDWYKEELFARFQPYKTEGNWLYKPL
ncbi:DUF3291 domain-containing protein [Aquimarina sp. W85]|uniref:DUF3291 domain-containing protein n=1 Tax=Aquimarina rhodophyticola TaxID=3342246 RepID=UPI003670C344